MHGSSALPIELGIVLAALATLAALASRFGYSPVPLYLVAGLALGPGGVAPVPAPGAFVQTGASIGVILLLLTLGLEFTVGEFTASIRRHLPSAWPDLVVNAAPGAVAGWVLGLGWTGSIALAGITWVSSSGIVARLLGDLRRLANRETPAVLSVLVLEDIAMAAFLPLLAVLAAGGAWWQAALSIAGAVAAVTFAFVATHRHGALLGRVIDTDDPELLLLRILSLTLLVAGVTELMQASAAVGAFLVGLALTGQVADRTRRVIAPLRDLFAAVFFLAIGLSIDPRDIPPVLPAVIVLATVTAATKVAAAAVRGAPLKPGQMRRAMDLLGGVLVQVYGRLEGGWPLTILDQDDHAATSAGAPDHSCGRAVGSEVELRVRDNGELCTRSPMAVAEFCDPDGWCSLGDLARIDIDGYVHLEGRTDRMINTGYHVYPEEVEEALKGLPGVAAARVVGQPDERGGEVLAAYVIAVPGTNLDTTALTSALRGRLADYKVPRIIRLVDTLDTAYGRAR